MKPMMMTVNAIDAFQSYDRKKILKHQSRTSSDACNSSLSETIPVEEKDGRRHRGGVCHLWTELLAPDARASQKRIRRRDEVEENERNETKERQMLRMLVL